MYQNTPCFSTYSQPEANGFGFETSPQFSFRPQPINMMPPRGLAEPGMNPNNLTNQLATILHVSFNIEPKG
jgi:hypothetical protein